MTRICLLAAAGVGGACLAVLAARQPQGARPESPTAWHARFASEAGEYRRRVGETDQAVAMNRIAGFTREAPPRLIVWSECIGVPQGGHRDELWTADIAGTGAARLVDEPGMVISGVEPAAAGSRIAYVARPVAARTLLESWAVARLSVIDGSKGSTAVAAGGAIAPSWADDGGSLLFLRRVEGGWRPHRFDLASPSAPPRPVADVLFDDPTGPAAPAIRFSPDGQAVAGFREMQLVVARLGGGRPTPEYSSIAGRPVDLSWSPDSAWLCLKVGSEAGDFDWLVRVADGKQVELAGAVGIIRPPAATETIRIMSTAWMPGPKHRLLTLAHRGEATTCISLNKPGEDPVHERRWLIYDVDAATTTEVVGPPTDAPGLNDSQQVYLSPDGRYVGGRHFLYRFDESP